MATTIAGKLGGRANQRWWRSYWKALFSFFAAWLFVSSSTTACPLEKDQAIAFFSEYGDFASAYLMEQRGLSPPVEFRDLDTHARDYVSGNDLAVVFFATDRNKKPAPLCFIIWRDGQNDFAYGTISGGLERLTVASRRLRNAILSGQPSAVRAPRLRAGISLHNEPSGREKQPAEEIEAAIREMSQILFPESARASLANIRHLTIIPVQDMSTIPVEVLHPFGDARSVVDLFSVNFLALPRELEAPRREKMGWLPGPFKSPLIFGNPKAHDAEYDFPDLPGAEREARKAKSILGGVLLLGAKATKSAFLRDSNKHDLIVFAAHGIASQGTNLERSFIALADSRLTAAEVQKLRLEKGAVVVLSACQTGLGRPLDAGVIGLARAFQLAGAMNTTMSLWNVDDAATEFLMTSFYEELLLVPPAEAMRRAALRTRDRYPEPARWAAFAIFGPYVPIVSR